MKLQTELFGDVEVTDESIIVFPDGLIGFPQFCKYTIFELPEYQPFFGMQCIEEPHLSFVLVDPRMIVDEYALALSELDKANLGITSTSDLMVFALVVLHSDPNNMTANLQGPIVINPETKTGKQIIVTNEQYKLKHRLCKAV